MKITSKQDGVYPRTPAALAQQYDFGKVFDEITGIRLTVEEQEAMVKAELSLKLGYDDNDQIVSMLNASADIITITGNRLTIDSTYFSLSEDGTIYATAGEIGGCVIEDGVLKVPTANITGRLTADQIDTGSFTAKLDEIEERIDGTENGITSINTSLTVLSGQIESKVSQTIFDALGNRVSNAESNITQLPGQIMQRVSENYAPTSSLENLATKEALLETEGKITTTATNIRAEVKGNYATQESLKSYATKDSLKDYATTEVVQTVKQSIIDQFDDKLLLKVSKDDFNILGDQVKATVTEIEQTKDAITQRVTYTEFDSLGAEVAAVQGEISLKVDETNLISLINMAANEITITSDYFSLSADGTISATAGYIGNFNIGDGIYNDQTSLTGSGNGYPGVYIGTDGIGCGNGAFMVSSSGYLYAGDWKIVGGILSNDNGITLSATSPGSQYISVGSTKIYPDYISTDSIKGDIKFNGKIYTKLSTDLGWSPGYSDHVDVLEDIDKRKRLTFKNGILTAVTSI